MSQNEKISIALCTYNGARFLPEQLESFLKQTRLPDELIVCDDCSGDETPEIIENFAQNSPFPIYLHKNKENLRSTKNFEKAILLCRGDLIFLSDQDDYWMPTKLERIEAEFKKGEKIGMVFSDAELVNENLQPLNRRLWDHTFTQERQKAASKGNFLKILLSENVVNGATMAFRAEYREKFIPIPDDIPNLIHDGWISLLIANEAEVSFINEPLIKYRQHSAQQLGIDYNSKLDFARRKKRFAKSVEIARNESIRLNRLEQIFASANLQSGSWQKSISYNDLRDEKTQKAAHYEARKNLPLLRMNRFLPVCRELLTGRYNRFSNGFWSALKDLFERW